MIRWAHNFIRRRQPPTFFQGLFFNARRVNDHSFVQVYTERRQQNILWRNINRDTNIIAHLFNNANATVPQEGVVNDIEFVNLQGQRVATALTIWDFPDNAFNQALGTEFMVDFIIKIEIENDQEPNSVIMTLVIDYTPVY